VDNKQYSEFVRRSALLGGLPDEIAAEMMRASSWRRFNRGEMIFLQDEPARAIHIVAYGWVKLFRVTPNGAESVVSVLTRRQSFGEAVAFRKQPYPVSAEAVTECLLLEMPASVILSQMIRQPDVCVSILASTFQHLHELVAQLAQLKSQTGAQRVAEFLLDLAGSAAEPVVVTLPYDKVLIAGRLGLKPESLSRAFARLRKVGVEIERNHATITDLAALRDFVAEDPADAWHKAHKLARP